MRLRKGKIIPRDDGKRIEEFVGNATTQTRSVSVARMNAPPGWKEPAQTPEFDEVVMVLSGELTLRVQNGDKLVSRPFRKGETVHIPPKVIHQIEAVVDSDVLEASTPELDDLVRIQDRYGRG